MEPPEDYPGSTRDILHLVPVDGVEHTMVGCFCHPNINEANTFHAEMGLEDVGVPESEPGLLIFVHHKAGDSHVTEFRWEMDDDHA